MPDAAAPGSAPLADEARALVLLVRINVPSSYHDPGLTGKQTFCYNEVTQAAAERLCQLTHETFVP